MAIFVSTGYAQETETKKAKEDFTKVAKMLHGIWAGDVEKTAEEIKGMEDLDADEDEIEMMLERIGTIELNFKDGTFNVVIGDQEMKGDWEVTAAEKKDDTQTITIHVVPDESGGVEKKFEIHFIGKKHMKMIDLDEEGPPFVMVRKEMMSRDK